MTRAEKLNLLVSSLALVAAVALPLLSYNSLTPQLQELRLRRPLIVDTYAKKWGEGHQYQIKIQNPSKLPASDVKVTLVSSAFAEEHPPVPRVDIFPASPFTIESNRNVSTVSIMRAIGPGEHIEVRVDPATSEMYSIINVVSCVVYSSVGAAILRDHVPPPIFGGGRAAPGSGSGGSY